MNDGRREEQTLKLCVFVKGASEHKIQNAMELMVGDKKIKAIIIKEEKFKVIVI